MDYHDAVRYLHSLVDYETKPIAGRVKGLRVDTTLKLMWCMGDPYKTYPVVHITGTNGKGSTVHMTARILQAMGLRVGVYTSPHLVEPTERIKIDDTAIDPSTFGSLVGDIARFADFLDIGTTWFETMTAVGLAYFADVAVDVAVVEVGMLGRFDATNVVEADVAVLTNVELDHSNGKGNWRKTIAEEKAGIVKSTSRVVCGETNPEVKDVFRAERSVSMIERDKDFGVLEDRLAVGGRYLSLYTPRARYEELFMNMHGHHQADNASLAITTAETFFDAALPEDLVNEALADTTLEGRFEIIQRRPLVVMDVAHNPNGIQAMTTTFKRDFATAGCRILVLGLLKGRDLESLIEAFELDNTDHVVACTAPTARGVSAVEIAKVARRAGAKTETQENPAEAFQRALTLAQPEDSVIVCGSFTVVGAVKASLSTDFSD